MPASVTVVGLGCELDRLFAGQRPALPVPGPPDRDGLRDLLETVGAAVRTGDSVLVIVGDWLPPETLDRVHTVHSLLQTDRMAIHVTDLPPLAASVLAALAAALAPSAESAGALVGALDALSDQLLVLAWVGSVAGLRHPNVTLLHHARSVLPWTSFGVGVQPESFVLPLNRSTAEVPLVAPAQAIDLLIAPAENAELDWIVGSVAPALGGAPVRRLPPTLHGAQWWGTSRLVEAVGVPTNLEGLARVTLRAGLAPCRWCGEPIARSPCPFCGDAALDERRLGRAPSLQVDPASTLAGGG